VEETIDARVFAPPEDLWTWPQNLCLDAGYDSKATRILVAEKGFVAHIRSRRAEMGSKRRHPRGRARRWVVERTHSWMNRYRRLLTRWEKRAENYLAMAQFACALITLQAAWRSSG
jgi:transposase